MVLKTSLSNFSEDQLYTIANLYKSIRNKYLKNDTKLVVNSFKVKPNLNQIEFRTTKIEKHEFFGHNEINIPIITNVIIKGVELDSLIRNENLRYLISDEPINNYIKTFGVLQYLMSLIKSDSATIKTQTQATFNQIKKILTTNPYFCKNKNDSLRMDLFEVSDVIFNNEKQQIYIKSIRNEKVITTLEVMHKSINMLNTQLNQDLSKYTSISKSEYIDLLNRRLKAIQEHPKYKQWNKLETAKLIKFRKSLSYFDVDRDYIYAILKDRENVLNNE